MTVDVPHSLLQRNEETILSPASLAGWQCMQQLTRLLSTVAQSCCNLQKKVKQESMLSVCCRVVLTDLEIFQI